MKLSEIKTVVPQSKNIINYKLFDEDKKEAKGLIDGHELFLIPGSHAGELLFRIKEDNKPAIDLYAIQDLNEPKRLHLRFIWTYPEFRNRGFAVAMYKVLYKDLGYSLVSDKDLAKGTLHIWLKYLQQMGDLRVFNVKTGEEENIKPEDAVDDENLLFVLEDRVEYPILIKEGKYAGMCIPNRGNGMISDYHRFIDHKYFYNKRDE